MVHIKKIFKNILKRGSQIAYSYMLCHPSGLHIKLPQELWQPLFNGNILREGLRALEVQKASN